MKVCLPGSPQSSPPSARALRRNVLQKFGTVFEERLDLRDFEQQTLNFLMSANLSGGCRPVEGHPVDAEDLLSLRQTDRGLIGAVILETPCFDDMQHPETVGRGGSVATTGFQEPEA